MAMLNCTPKKRHRTRRTAWNTDTDTCKGVRTGTSSRDTKLGGWGAYQFLENRMPQNIVAVCTEREQGRRWAREREKLRVSENALQRTSDGSMQTVAFWVQYVITLPYLGAGCLPPTILSLCTLVACHSCLSHSHPLTLNLMMPF